VISKVAPKFGWEWEQRGAAIDYFRKGGRLIEVTWDPDAVNGFSINDGVRVTRREKFKLERLCRALGADVKDGQYFQNLPYGHPARIDNLPALKKQAIEGLRIVIDSSVLPESSNEERLEDAAAKPSDGRPAPPNTKPNKAIRAVETLPPEASESDNAEFDRITTGPVIQREAQLRAKFEEYLEGTHKHKIAYYEIPTPTTVIYSDTADLTAQIIYEAKGSAERMAVRLAIGQVLDYGRYVEGARLALLLPETPAPDMLPLLEFLGIGCVVKTGPGEFTDLTSLGRCP
jgi:hypothetical protein